MRMDAPAHGMHAERDGLSRRIDHENAAMLFGA